MCFLFHLLFQPPTSRSCRDIHWSAKKQLYTLLNYLHAWTVIKTPSNGSKSTIRQLSKAANKSIRYDQTSLSKWNISSRFQIIKGITSFPDVIFTFSQLSFAYKTVFWMIDRFLLSNSRCQQKKKENLLCTAQYSTRQYSTVQIHNNRYQGTNQLYLNVKDGFLSLPILKIETNE